MQKKNRQSSSENRRFFGGDGEIRTLEPLLTVTRFPVARPRPTRRHLQNYSVLTQISNNKMVPVTGVEPVRYRYHWILSPARLPIPSHRHILETSLFLLYLLP